MQIYNKINIKTIAYKIKSKKKKMQIQDFYSSSTQPDLHLPLSNFNLKLEVPLIQGFQTIFFKQCNWIMVPINLLRLLAPNTFYNPQEIPHY